MLLKGATTLVASPYQDFYSQSEGTPWLATAGSGDVLAGVIGALLAQVGSDVGRFRAAGIDPDERWAAIAAMAASLHGRAGAAPQRRPADGGPHCGRPSPESGVKSVRLAISGWERNSHTHPLR